MARAGPGNGLGSVLAWAIFFAAVTQTMANNCTCTDGSAATGTNCTTDGDEICASCNPGYTLRSNVCEANNCTCTGGSAATGTNCTTDGDEICASCNPGYTLRANVCEGPWINEFHYKNAGADTGEFLEIAGPAGSSLDGWKVVLYGSSGASYAEVSLNGSIDDELNGIGALDFEASRNLQGRGGLALVDSSGHVVEFLSYGGDFTASDGPAQGLTATDVGVAEDDSTPVGNSIQRTGNGTDFRWQAPQAESRGTLNPSQLIYPDAWINEFHYHNTGNDTGEFVEIVGPVGLPLDGWSVVFYNGSSGTEYLTVSLHGSIDNELYGYGALFFPVSGIQDSPGGLALVDPAGVVEFLSYGGSFMATDGPAQGLTATDVNVSESNGTPVGHSIQLAGRGTAASDFAWQAPAVDSPGEFNAGQTVLESGPWINEFHYHNAGADTSEFVEIAGPTGVSLDGWSVVFYDGMGGTSYRTMSLRGGLDDEEAGFGALAFAVPSIQNGLPAGMALVDPSSNVIEFLSYGGSFTATAGPAQGLTSTDIGVTETSSTLAGNSLQRTGHAIKGSDFAFVAQLESPGRVNARQSFGTAGTGCTCSDGTPATGSACVASGTEICASCNRGYSLIDDLCEGPWINEIHYDDSGTTTSGFVEVAGPAGVLLNGWSLVFYDGTNGSSYSTVRLTGSIDHEDNGYGAIAFPVSGIRDTRPAGLVLVDPDGDVAEFPSYGGRFAATDGPARGSISTSLPVEGDSSRVGFSFQRTGLGLTAGAFVWQWAEAGSRGSLNEGQTLASEPPCLFGLLGNGFCFPTREQEKPWRIDTWVLGRMADAERACCQSPSCVGFHRDNVMKDYVLLRKVGITSEDDMTRECWVKIHERDAAASPDRGQKAAALARIQAELAKASGARPQLPLVPVVAATAPLLLLGARA